MAMILTQEAYSIIDAATTSGGAINLTYMGIGDCNGSDTYTPVATQTQLVNELYRSTITRSVSSIEEDSTSLVLYLNVPASIGGFTVREIGVYTNAGVLFAVGNTTPIYKPTAQESNNLNLSFRCTLIVTQQVNIEVVSDPNYTILSGQIKDEIASVLSEHESDNSTHRNLIGLLPSGGSEDEVLIRSETEQVGKWKGQSLNIPFLMSIDENLNSFIN